ncbi:MAG: type II secretion system protein GspC [Desulfobacteraceae bacterium]|jgi:general secretion pathway protein C
MTKHIYTILNILAIGAIIFVGVNTFYLIFEAKLDQPDFEKASVTQKPSESKKSRIQRQRDYDAITRRSIFGKIASDILSPDMDTSELENLEPTTLNISLIGTGVYNQEKSVAIISVKSKRPPQGMYYIGDSVEGALIKNILTNKVVLSVNGKDEILEKNEEPTRTSAASYSPVREPVRRASTSVPTRTIPLQRDDVEEALSDLQNLLTQASIKPHFSDGEPDGLAITGVKVGSIFRKMGLRNGDIVKSVEGNEIRSPEDLISLYEDLQSKENVSLKLIRRGRERDINLRFR